LAFWAKIVRNVSSGQPIRIYRIDRKSRIAFAILFFLLILPILILTNKLQFCRFSPQTQAFLGQAAESHAERGLGNAEASAASSRSQGEMRTAEIGLRNNEKAF
jgi:hypothetical protein